MARGAGTVGSRHTGTTVRTRGSQVEPLSSDTSIPAPAAPRARRSAVARRRPAALLVALVVGGIAAAVVGTQGVPTAGAQESLAVSDMLGSDAEGMLELELNPQEAITEVEAQEPKADSKHTKGTVVSMRIRAVL